MLINVLRVEKNLPKGVAKGVNLTSVFRVYSQEKSLMPLQRSLIWHDAAYSIAVTEAEQKKNRIWKKKK